MKIAFQLLTTLFFLVLTPAIVLGVVVMGISAIWRKEKPKPMPAVQSPKETAVDDTAPVAEVQEMTVDSDIDWAKVSVCDLNKVGHA